MISEQDGAEVRIGLRSRLLAVAKTVAINVQWGLQWAFAFAAVYVVWVTISLAIGGQRAFERNHVTYWSTVLSYLESALVSGILLGLLRPLTKRRSGSVLVGFVIGTATGLTLALAMEPAPTIEGKHIFVSAIIGLIGAFVAWRWSAQGSANTEHR